MTASQNHPLSRRVSLAAGMRLTPKQREWIAALDRTYGSQDRALRIVAEPALSHHYDIVVEARFGRTFDHEVTVWTVSSAGTARIW